jgi:RimJ/RimL family protein N-acetyltransferase/acyl carrier protein
MVAGPVPPDQAPRGEPARLVRAEPDLSPDAFRARLADELCLDPDALRSETRFVEDLAFDSVRMLELALVLDVLGVSADAEDLKRIASVQDAYDMYVDRTAVWLYGEQGADELPWDAGTAQGTSGPPLPSLRSRRTRQRPVVRSDYPYLYDLTQRRDAVVLWRHRGRCLSPESFPATLWRSVLIQHVVVHAANATPVGFVSAFDADLRSGTAHLDVVLDPCVQGQGWPYEAAVLFVDHLFRWWPLRKLYVRSLTPLGQSLGSGLGRVFVEEGRLVEHEYVDGTWADLHLLATTRRLWDEHAPRLIERIVDPRGPRGGG